MSLLELNLYKVSKYDGVGLESRVSAFISNGIGVKALLSKNPLERERGRGGKEGRERGKHTDWLA